MPHRTDIARVALRKIAERRLPPTPENFLRFYQEGLIALGIADSEDFDMNIVARVEDVVDRAAANTESLAADLVVQNKGLAAAIDNHVGRPASSSDPSLAVLMTAAMEILSIVQASQRELAETKKSLDSIKAELQENRKLLGQDPLTGTENRRSLSVILEREIVRAREENAPLSVAVIDIDHFKIINDKYGHAAGDSALIHLTKLATSALRGDDTLARYGGEEFVLVLPETAADGAIFAVKRFQSFLSRSPFIFEGVEILMTFSAGVATLHSLDDQAALLQRADTALYVAKRTGRNRVVDAGALD